MMPMMLLFHLFE